MGTLSIGVDRDAFHKQFTIIKITIAVLEVDFALANRFYLGPLEYHSAYEFIQ
jgi:hypothetical protein